MIMHEILNIMAPVRCIFLPLPQKQAKFFNFFAITQEIPLSDKYVFQRLRGDYLSKGERYFLIHFPLLVAELNFQMCIEQQH